MTWKDSVEYYKAPSHKLEQLSLKIVSVRPFYFVVFPSLCFVYFYFLSLLCFPATALLHKDYRTPATHLHTPVFHWNHWLHHHLSHRSPHTCCLIVWSHFRLCTWDAVMEWSISWNELYRLCVAPVTPTNQITDPDKQCHITDQQINLKCITFSGQFGGSHSDI